jgi:hypothetical protein
LPPRSFLPLQVPLQGSRGFYVRAERTSLPSHASDMLSARLQAIGRTRTFTSHRFTALSTAPLTVGVYDDGLPGEIFITMAKEGSTVSGLMDAFATVVSLDLQHGVPLKVLCGKLSHMRFEPSGWSGNPQIGYAKSIMDYLFRWLELRFLDEQGHLFESLLAPIQAPPPNGKGLGEVLNAFENRSSRSPAREGSYSEQVRGPAVCADEVEGDNEPAGV